MIANEYKDKSNTVITSISGGREHFVHRRPVRATSTYKYRPSFGENFHTLSKLIYGSDEFYWAIADLNKPMDVFNIFIGEQLNLPDDVIETTKKIF